jgi:glycosyltransferase involved in cell wall biosynthesis
MTIRVAMVSPASEQLGGLELSFARLVPALAERSVAAHAVVVGGSRASLALRTLSSHLPVSVADSPAELLAHTRRSHIVHFHAPDLLAFDPAFLGASRRSNAACVLTMHLPSYPPVIGAWYARARARGRMLRRGWRLARLPIQLFAPSDEAAATARSRLGPWARVSTLRNGVPDRGATELPPFPPLRLASLARLDSHKQIDVLIAAVAKAAARGSDVRLNLAGAGPLARDLGQLARDLGVESRVNFLGHIDNPTDLLNQSHALVLTSATEGAPLAAAEAAAVGRPLIARRGLEGIGIWGGGAVLAPPEAGPDEFADCFDRLGDPETLRTAGAAARLVYERWLTDEMAGDAWATVYRAAVRRS